MMGGWNLPLNKWQERTFEVYLGCREPVFMRAVRPGIGKVKFALRAAHSALAAGLAERVVVVCPTQREKLRWADAASEVGIRLDHDWRNCEVRESSDFVGVVVTYHQVASLPKVHRAGCRVPTLAILDWGNYIAVVTAGGAGTGDDGPTEGGPPMDTGECLPDRIRGETTVIFDEQHRLGAATVEGKAACALRLARHFFRRSGPDSRAALSLSETPFRDDGRGGTV